MRSFFARRAHLRVLRAHGDPERMREEAEQVEEGAVLRHVVVAIEVGGKAPHEPLELLDLIPHLDAGLVRLGPLGLDARVPHELPLPVQQRGDAPRIGDRRPQREVDVKPHPQPRAPERLELRRIGPAIHHEGGAGHDAVLVALEDAPAHAPREAEVVGVDDEPARRAHRCPITRRK